MKKLVFFMLFVVGLLFAQEIKIPKYTDIVTGKKVDCTEVYMRLQNNEEIDCDKKFDINEDTDIRLKRQEDCECKSRIYEMPGGKGHFDRIIGKDPKTGKVEPYYQDVTREEADVIRAKNAHKKAVKKAEVAKNKLEDVKKSGKNIEKAQEEYDEAIRDVELSKAKIKDTEKIFKESKKQK